MIDSGHFLKFDYFFRIKSKVIFKSHIPSLSHFRHLPCITKVFFYNLDNVFASLGVLYICDKVLFLGHEGLFLGKKLLYSDGTGLFPDDTELYSDHLI